MERRRTSKGSLQCTYLEVKSGKHLEVLADFLRAQARTGKLEVITFTGEMPLSVIDVLLELVGQEQFRYVEFEGHQGQNAIGARLVDRLVEKWRAEEAPNFKFSMTLRGWTEGVKSLDWKKAVQELYIAKYIKEKHQNGKDWFLVDDTMGL
ncbi:hypothetical protein QR680_012278 [Steinernema hermaphroditum]|uniref:Uncharacterized protein n=1 Tax=Steinernema hermaphroditum TaxID=289476 RepID=A0AA39I3U3_9BILA|nr:hypothetical protein QR680_012278 [Steinernema hermaphroditum]